MTGLPCFPRTPVCHFSQSAMSIISILYHVFWLLMLNCFSIFICSVQNFSEDKHSRFVAIPCWRTKYFWCSKKRFYFLDFSCTFFAALISTLHTACGASWRFISLWRLCLPLTERQRSEVNYDRHRTSQVYDAPGVKPSAMHCYDSYLLSVLLGVLSSLQTIVVVVCREPRLQPVTCWVN